MKILIILLLSFSALAEYELSFSANESGDMQSKTFGTELEAKNRAIEIAKSNKWRKGVFNSTESNSLYAEGELFYHPTNWSYSIADVTAEKLAKKDKKDSDAASLSLLAVKVTDGTAKLSELLQYIKLRDGL